MTHVTEEQIAYRHHQLKFRMIDFIKNQRTFEGIIIEHYVILQKIGQGAFAQIYRGVDQNDNKQVAVKVLNLRTIQTQKNFNLKKIKRRLADEESKIMMKFNHPNILKCYQCFQSKDFKIMILQFCNSGSLQDRIYEQGPIPQNEAVSILKQIINGVGVFHHQKIIHRDMKPDNILIHNGVYKIADFGFSKVLDIQNEQDITQNTRLGTIITMAPQVLNGDRYGLKADIWSIGVIFFYMLFGECPFKSDTAIEMVAEITNTRLLTEEVYKGVRPSENAKRFLRQVLVVDIQKRLGWKQLFNHDLLNAQSQGLGNNFQRQVALESINSNSNTFIKEQKTFEQGDTEAFGTSNEQQQQQIEVYITNKENKQNDRQRQFEIQSVIESVPRGIIDTQKQDQHGLSSPIEFQMSKYLEGRQGEKICSIKQQQPVGEQVKEQQQTPDGTATGYKKLTRQQQLLYFKNIDRSQAQTYKWAQRIYIQCKKTQVLYQQIIKPIQQFKLLDLGKRSNIQFMYLVSTRCLNNMSPINEQYNKRKCSKIIRELNDKLKDLYKKVTSTWMKYSKLLTAKESEVYTMALDWFAKRFAGQMIKKKDKYLSGIENMRGYKEQGQQKGKCQQVEHDKELLDYDKLEQITYTVEYIGAVVGQLKASPLGSSEVIRYLGQYKDICLIDFMDLRTRTFDQYLTFIIL